MIIPYLIDPYAKRGTNRFFKPNQYLPIFNYYLPIFSLCLLS